jgi:cell division inhibitor SepF
VSVLSKFKDFMGLNDEEDFGDYDETEEAYRAEYQMPETQTTQAVEEDRRTQRLSTVDRPRSTSTTTSKVSNVVGMPGIMHGVAEMILIEPRSFEEMPQVIDALKQRKSVILNMTLIRQEEAQRSVDFVAGGTYAIDGHYERIGDNIFLFTPNCVQVTTPANATNTTNTVVNQTPVAQTTRTPRPDRSVQGWGSETTMQAVQ